MREEEVGDLESIVALIHRFASGEGEMGFGFFVCTKGGARGGERTSHACMQSSKKDKERVCVCVRRERVCAEEERERT